MASLLAQYLADKGRLDGCFDTDPVNGSFQNIPALKAQPVQLLERNAIHVKGVDRLIENIIAAGKEVVIDNGAASFLPLSRYLIENDIPGVLAQQGVTMIIHTVVTGGGNGLDTLKGLDALIRHFAPAAQVIVWVNEFFGPARYDGVEFEQTSVYTGHRQNIRGLIYLRELDRELFAPNLAELLERKLTFAEAAASDTFMLMEKSRLHRIRQDIWGQLSTVL